jgi:hypothetical protein
MGIYQPKADTQQQCEALLMPPLLLYFFIEEVSRMIMLVNLETVVSIGHRVAHLAPFHEQVLNLDPLSIISHPKFHRDRNSILR